MPMSLAVNIVLGKPLSVNLQISKKYATFAALKKIEAYAEYG